MLNIKSFTQNAVVSLGTEIAVDCIPILEKVPTLRHTMIKAGAKYVQYAQQKNPKTEFEKNRPPGVLRDRAEFGQAIVHSVDRAIQRGISPMVLRKFATNLIQGAFAQTNTAPVKREFLAKYGSYPPAFLTISPGKTCNLHCIGCYASSSQTKEKLDWDIFNRIITEAKEEWGVSFLVISGGEPLIYRSNGKGILDAVEAHPDIFFLMYTNGTLIDQKTAQRMAELGNITPAISVEGWRERTDERRGEGVYDKVLAAMANLREAGVLFGVSLTATRYNAEEIFSDAFLDFFFEEQGAMYGWVFHYMPIGRSFTLDLMPTADQRIWMWQRSWEIIKERKFFLADFWNHGTLSNGCIAGGRTQGNGYLYIDWDGNISPCVFVPYSPVNIHDIYANGGTLTSAWQSPFFNGIRNWQEGYAHGKGNWLAPCIIRDHHAELRSLIERYEPDPIDDSAQKALLDPEYRKGLEAYDKEYMEKTQPIWQSVYLDGNDRESILDNKVH